MVLVVEKAKRSYRPPAVMVVALSMPSVLAITCPGGVECPGGLECAANLPACP